MYKGVLARGGDSDTDVAIKTLTCDGDREHTDEAKFSEFMQEVNTMKYVAYTLGGSFFDLF